MKTIETRDIIPGMVLFYTKETVLSTPVKGLSKPHNLDFVVSGKNGIIQKSFNRHQLIAIAL